jgi:3-methyl-2-oxobutanoate hydroxymethyltransferase
MLDKCGIDAVLVGDSLGMVFQGRKDTIPVTVDEIIYHVKAVKARSNCALVIADMPFMSYQSFCARGKKKCRQNNKESGADAVKLEGGEEIIPQIKAINAMGVPEWGILGFSRSRVKIYGGYPVQGKDKFSRHSLLIPRKTAGKGRRLCNCS